MTKLLDLKKIRNVSQFPFFVSYANISYRMNTKNDSSLCPNVNLSLYNGQK